MQTTPPLELQFSTVLASGTTKIVQVRKDAEKGNKVIIESVPEGIDIYQEKWKGMIDVAWEFIV